MVDNGGELEIPDSVNMSGLVEAANYFDVLNAPINVPSHVRDQNILQKMRLTRLDSSGT